MSFYNSASAITKKIIIATAVFLLYGYLCRLVGLYLFWESKTIGWVFFWIMLVFILRDRIKQKRNDGKKVLIEKIGIGISLFVVFVKAVMFFVIPQTSAYDSAVTFIKSDKEIEKSIGSVKSIFVVPYGSISMSTNSDGSTSQANLYFIVKGSKKFIDVNLVMAKELYSAWRIEVAGR